MIQKKPYLIDASYVEFQALLKRHESVANAGCLTEYDAAGDRTLWTVAGQLCAVTKGPLGARQGCWMVVHLTDSQRELAADQACNNDVSDDVEFTEFLFTEGRIELVDREAILLERNRCLTNPMYEPLLNLFEA